SGITGFSRVLRQVADHAPLRRNIDPGEIAHAAVFLVSDAARAITGEVIHVDAGYNIMGL
ncbi:MAG: SDR family oxidoreductase, partial [bacterium]|nr:SDR family oxidoreductase [bacterium]